uniref:Uncharacterized protein n=1 Tax=Tanacetum cinerariifolium TaxID=118510 RepID=A0A6L2NRC7_TANCI|nr:hypothetical protein [Tanacetum cinerariifolium]
MSVKPIWRKKLNPCNTSNELNVSSPTQMPKPLTPHHEPSHENNHLNQALPNPYIKDTPTTPQVISHPPFPILPINSHVTHTQVPLQGMVDSCIFMVDPSVFMMDPSGAIPANGFFSSLGCLTNLPFLLKNFLKFLMAIAYSSSSLPDVEVSSSQDSFLAFKAWT